MFLGEMGAEIMGVDRFLREIIIIWQHSANLCPLFSAHKAAANQ